MGRHQTGHIFESASGAFHVRCYATEIVDGHARRVQRSHLLCHKDDKHYSTTCKAVKLLRGEFMRPAKVSEDNVPDITVPIVWEEADLAYSTASTQAVTGARS